MPPGFFRSQKKILSPSHLQIPTTLHSVFPQAPLGAFSPVSGSSALYTQYLWAGRWKTVLGPSPPLGGAAFSVRLRLKARGRGHPIPSCIFSRNPPSRSPSLGVVSPASDPQGCEPHGGRRGASGPAPGHSYSATCSLPRRALCCHQLSPFFLPVFGRLCWWLKRLRKVEMVEQVARVCCSTGRSAGHRERGRSLEWKAG